MAIYKSCDLIRRLIEENFSVTVVMTEAAEEFIKPLLFQSLSGNKVYRGMFDAPESWNIEHISLADTADLVLIAPATANIIGKIAAGICDDLLTCVVAATKSKVAICPAMNENMYNNIIVQGNINKLKKAGYYFIGPKKGKLACGKTGLGCLAEVDLIVKETKNLLAGK